MNLSKPNRDLVDTSRDKGQALLSQLIEFYDALLDLGRPQLPSTVPNLKSVTLETLAALRRTVGDPLGEKGPRSIILAGGTDVMDATAGVWVWDPTSTLTDDGVSVIQVSGVIAGRWRKLSGATAPAGTSMTDFTADLGTGRSSGTFDVTGLPAMTVGKNVAIWQTAQAIASKGGARDELEMDNIQATGYVLSSTSLRAYWHAPAIVTGIYAFAFTVGA